MKELNLVNYFVAEKDLRVKSTPIAEINENILEFAEKMQVIMNNSNGIGLAAVQVGKPIRMFIVGIIPELSSGEDIDSRYIFDKSLDDSGYQCKSDNPIVFINPKIISFSDEKVPFNEGCLSLLGSTAIVERPRYIHIEYTNIEGILCQLKAYGLLGVCIQHEYDHLNGILYIDHLSSSERERVLSELKKNSITM